MRTLSKLDGSLRRLVAALFFAVALLPLASEESLAQDSSPRKVYDQAWQIVNDQFVDPSFNGQDWSSWKNRYGSKLRSRDDALQAISTMLSSLNDPYTRALSRKMFEVEKNQIEARLFGIGAQLAKSKENKTIVIAPIEGSPAFNAGILTGDQIVTVNGEDLETASLDEVVGEIRGPAGTEVTIGINRDGQQKSIKIVRGEITIRAIANQSVLPGNIGYIRLDSLIVKNAPAEVRQALERLKSADGIILDLRNNPGGLLSNSQEIAELFIDEGALLYSTVSRKAVEATKSKSPALSHQPLVVLVNKGTASGAEILASALRDNGRAKLIGEKTFGKGIVQAIFNLADGSGMNVTVGSYRTARNRVFHNKGLEPDYTVETAADNGPWWFALSSGSLRAAPTDGKDLQLRKAIWAVRNQIAFARGLPPDPDPEPSGPGRSTHPQSASGTLDQKTQVTPEEKPGQRPIKDKWALLVGISNFKKASLNLKYPAKDAGDLAEFLVNQCHFARDHVKVLADQKATRSSILDALGDKWLPRVVRPDDLVLLYFSTHGSPSDLDVGGVNYLIAWDTDPESLYSTGLPMQDLIRIIKARIRSDRIIVLLDACYSGAVDPQSKGVHRAANVNVEAICQGTGQMVISSSAPDQVSWECKQQSNSVFTKHLINSLKVDGDRTKLGRAFKLLREKVEDEVQRDRGRLQSPVLKSQWEGDELMIAVPPTDPRPGLAVPD
ncbi:MAG: caspase family protein [Cyanobacteria bacterium HKST-UBA02]|nr:caspase family protein [Cyanobacteria bacterium HKST-UBA02]